MPFYTYTTRASTAKPRDPFPYFGIPGFVALPSALPGREATDDGPQLLERPTLAR